MESAFSFAKVCISLCRPFIQSPRAWSLAEHQKAELEMSKVRKHWAHGVSVQESQMYAVG